MRRSKGTFDVAVNMDETSKKYPKTLQVVVRSEGKPTTRSRTLNIPPKSTGQKSPLPSPRIHYKLPDFKKVSPKVDNRRRIRVEDFSPTPSKLSTSASTSSTATTTTSVARRRINHNLPNLKGVKAKIDMNRRAKKKMEENEPTKPKPNINHSLPDITKVISKVDNKGLIPIVDDDDDEDNDQNPGPTEKELPSIFPDW